jgi:hypothetical protein
MVRVRHFVTLLVFVAIGVYYGFIFYIWRHLDDTQTGFAPDLSVPSTLIVGMGGALSFYVGSLGLAKGRANDDGNASLSLVDLAIAVLVLGAIALCCWMWMTDFYYGPRHTPKQPFASDFFPALRTQAQAGLGAVVAFVAAKLGSGRAQ